MSDIGDQIERGSEEPEWEQCRRTDLTTYEAAELDRLRSAVAFLRGHVTQNAGGGGQSFAYVWQSVWDEFERRLGS